MRLMFAVLLAVAAGAAALAAAGPSLAADENRVALVIGNGAYKLGALKNPVNDARAMAAVLKQIGFQVIAVENASKPEMERAVAEFGHALTPGSVALFYYAGHGLQLNGHNFLVPVDAEIATEPDVRLQALDADAIVDQLVAAGSDVNLMILDACRNNPFEQRFRSQGGGLAQIDAPKGTLIAYATAPGHVASDGAGANGLYTAKLIEAIKTPGIPIEEMFKRVRIAVSQATADAQTPWEASSLVGDFYFSGPTTVVVNAPVDRDALYWQSVKDFLRAFAHPDLPRRVSPGRLRAARQGPDRGAEQPGGAGRARGRPQPRRRLRRHLDRHLRLRPDTGHEDSRLHQQDPHLRASSRAASPACSAGTARTARPERIPIAAPWRMTAA